jgi:hypothetical protein
MLNPEIFLVLDKIVSEVVAFGRFIPFIVKLKLGWQLDLKPSVDLLTSYFKVVA